MFGFKSNNYQYFYSLEVVGRGSETWSIYFALFLSYLNISKLLKFKMAARTMFCDVGPTLEKHWVNVLCFL